MINEFSDVIIFSKDRPWQLGELLRTMLKYTDFNNIHVLVKIQSPYEDNYNIIKKRFGNRVTFHSEDDGFKNSFFKILDMCPRAVAFMVDDVAFYNTFSSKNAVSIMARMPILAYQFKMHKTYSHCQTAGKEQQIPSSLVKFEDHWIWKDNDGTWDWNYPFDLTGSIYIKNDIEYALNKISEMTIRNPNDLEIAGAEICIEKGIPFFNKTYMACQEERVCACLALNHVNPRKNKPWSVKPDAGILHFNKSIFDKYQYDEYFFRTYNQNSVHITDYKLINTGSSHAV